MLPLVFAAVALFGAEPPPECPGASDVLRAQQDGSQCRATCLPPSVALECAILKKTAKAECDAETTKLKGECEAQTYRLQVERDAFRKRMDQLDARLASRQVITIEEPRSVWSHPLVWFLIGAGVTAGAVLGGLAGAGVL
jgi:hypothetical protein